MKKRNTKRIGCFCAGLFAVYVIAYIPMTIAGRYEPAAFRPGGGPDGELMMIPILALGYQWRPAVIYPVDGTSNQPLPFLYQPLIGLDFWLWHTQERVNSGRYRIVNWFVTETRTYSTVEPN